jgi:hypothetical protein
MKTYIFKRESKNFDDILSDPSIKSVFKTKIFWKNELMICSTYGDEVSNMLDSYILLKYGEDLTPSIIKDFTPIPYVDYYPDPKRPDIFKNVYK